MLPILAPKRVPGKSPKAPAAPPTVLVALDSLPPRIQQDITSAQRRAALADDKERKRKAQELLRLQVMCAQVLVDQQILGAVAKNNNMCNKKLKRCVEENGIASCTGPLEQFRIVGMGRPKSISDVLVVELKEVMRVRDLAGDSIEHVPTVRKSAAIRIPGYDPAENRENSFAT
jgi:hypothetical protein